jgi:RNA polymerase sigma-70 factor (ECF subfamily)
MIKNFSNDEVLVKHLRKGDEFAFTYLVDKYHHLLCVFATSLTRDKHQSEDIVQNVFFNIWKKRKDLKDDFNIKNFLFRSVRNEFIDQYRKKKSKTALENIYYTNARDKVIEEKATDSSDHMMKIVKQEIEHLPPKCKEIFMLSKQENLTNVEISEYLRISIKTVEAQITKAFRILRDKFDGRTDNTAF